MNTMNTSNTQILNKPEHIISLATSSLLVAVDVSVWTGSKQDRVISDEVTTAKNADKNAGRFVKHLLADDPDHKAVLNYRQTVYNWLQRDTYDWSGLQRILPVINLPDFMKKYTAHEAAFNVLVENFLAKYPSIVSDMAFKAAGGMGDMFRREDYPSADQLRRKFSINLYTSEVPMSDYRCGIASDLAEDLHKNYEKQTGRLIDEIVSKQAEQFAAVMESISHCTDSEIVTDKNGEQKVKRRKIYEATINRALELCDTFRTFNLTADVKLEEARESLEKALRGVTVEQLRESDTVREQVKTEVDDILSRFRPAARA